MARILVIDDDISSLELIRVALERVGHEVCAVETGEEGIKMAGVCAPDLILLDIRLRHMTGYEVAKGIRAAGFLNMPIIAVSVPVQSRDEETAYHAGCDAFLAKPFNLEQLRGIVASYLN